jgi:hypothetical protein
MGFSPYGPLRKTRTQQAASVSDRITQQAATVRERVTHEFARIDPAPKSDIWNMQSEIHYSHIPNTIPQIRSNLS